jgi:hypothetical protein
VSKLFFGAVVLTALLAGQDCAATAPPGYYLVWNDEFSGRSLDSSF